MIKIFITEYEKDGKVYAGPYLCATSWDIAEAAAEAVGFTVIGELKDLIPSDYEDYLEENPTIH
tara:strand:- start:19272 stop:19463 length:192 start_codon:yes stop_codon:yes gene_type:complete